MTRCSGFNSKRKSLSVLALLLAVTLLGACAGLTLRGGGGAAVTTNGEVGLRVMLSAGLYAPIGGSNRVAGSIRGGVTGEENLAAGGALDWSRVVGSRFTLRAGPDYLKVLANGDDELHKLLGVTVAALYSHGEDRTVTDKSWLTSKLDSEDRIEERLGFGIEFAANLVVHGDASAGRGIGYGGVTIQYDRFFEGFFKD